jgi:hypothetical protein
LLKIHIIPDLILLLEVPTASTVFPTASTGLLLEVPTALATSIVPDPSARVVSSVEVTIHNLDSITLLFSNHTSDISVIENNGVMLSKSRTEGT